MKKISKNKLLTLSLLPILATLPLVSISCYDVYDKTLKENEITSKYLIINKEKEDFNKKIDEFNNLFNDDINEFNKIPKFGLLTKKAKKEIENYIPEKDEKNKEIVFDKEMKKNTDIETNRIVYSKIQDYFDNLLESNKKNEEENSNKIGYQIKGKNNSYIFDYSNTENQPYDTDFYFLNKYYKNNTERKNDIFKFKKNLDDLAKEIDIMSKKIINIVSKNVIDKEVEKQIEELEIKQLDYFKKYLIYQRALFLANNYETKNGINDYDKIFYHSYNISKPYYEDNVIKKDNNDIFKEAKFGLSLKNIDDGFWKRSIRLFNNKGQGTILYANDDYMLILTAKNIFKKETKDDEFDFDDSLSFDSKYKTMKLTSDKYGNNFSVYDSKENTFKNINLDPSTFVLYKSNVKYNKYNYFFKDYDQILIKVPLKNIENKIKDIIKNNRAYNFKIKLTNEYFNRNDSSHKNYYQKNYGSLFLNKNLLKTKVEDLQYNSDLKILTTKDNQFKSYKITKGDLKFDWSETKGDLTKELTEIKYSISRGLNINQNEWFSNYDFNSNKKQFIFSNLDINNSFFEKLYIKNAEWLEKSLDNIAKNYKIFKGYFAPESFGLGIGNSKYEIADLYTNLFSDSSDAELFIQNLNKVKDSKRTNIVAYDEMKYILVGTINFNDKYSQSKDKFNLPILFSLASPISSDTVNLYNEILYNKI